LKKFFVILFITIFLAFSLSYIQTQWGHHPVLIGVRQVGLSSLSSLQRFVGRTGYIFSGQFASLRRLGQVDAVNLQLQQEIASLQIRMTQFDHLEQENKQLRKDLRYKRKNLYHLRTIAAEVIARGNDSWFETLVIDKGWKDGVETDRAVICREGLVGRVIETSPHFSKVMLLLNQNSNISVEVRRTGDKGIIQGRGTNDLILKYIPHSSVLAKGLPVYTSGISLVFPPGLLIGHISRIIKKKYDHLQFVDVKPAVSLTSLSRVWVVVSRQQKKIPSFLEETP